MRAVFLVFALLVAASCEKDETVSGYADLDAVYLLREIDGKPFAARATLTLPMQGHLAGDAPCNSYSGRQTLPYPWFKAEELAVTRRACPELAAESAFFEVLQAMSLAEVVGKVLILSNDAGREMLFHAK